METNYIFKLLILGDAGVGKSCLLLRFTNNRYTGRYCSTVGVDSRTRTLEIAGFKIKLHIWDTAGEERFRSMVSTYYRHVQGIVLVFDTTQRNSFNHIDYWLKEIEKYALPNICVMLVGNKCDALEKRQVRQELATDYADRLGLPYMEASAVSGVNVERMFGKLAVNIFDIHVLPTLQQAKGPQSHGISLSSLPKTIKPRNNKHRNYNCC
ncbi:Rab9Fb [Drosophila busckii]|uniref:Rab9Fb n=1 Tax=Drosophila busckii TaxID=30019 RepID=A0A0M3QZT1_DROBS|nr:ras-related protein ORAB-1 [Drosophila busckii]ALC49953.1 Rab9Fb [Drosophila busckii]